MSAPHRDRSASGFDGPPPGPLAAPLADPQAWSELARRRGLVDDVHRMTWSLTQGDFEALVICCELAARSAGGPAAGSGLHPASPQDAPAAADLPQRPPATVAPMALCDLAAATGIPRETVRRKLQRLAVVGLVQRVPRGWLLRDAAPHDAAQGAAVPAAGGGR